MPNASNLIDILSCALAFALVLWGLRLFKIYIILMGVAFGAAIGFILGGIIGHSTDVAIAGAVIMAIVGGIIAWPLQKILVFIAVGMFTSSLGLILAAGLRAPPDTWWVIGLVLFVLGGLVALAFYEPFIIIMLSFGAGQSIFQTAIPYQVWQHSANNLGRAYEVLANFYYANISTFLLICSVYIGFGLYFQRIIEYSHVDNEEERKLKALYRRTTYLFAALAFLAYSGNNLVLTSTRVWTLILGPNLISWPLIAFCATMILGFIKNNVYGAEQKWYPRQLVLFSFLLGVLLVPMCDWLTLLVVAHRVWPLPFWDTFFNAPDWVVTIKWIYSLLVFPCLFFFGVLKWKPSQEQLDKAEAFTKRDGITKNLGIFLKPQARTQAQLVCLAGVYEGEKFPLGQHEVTLGRDPQFSTIVFPSDQRLISRRHAIVRYNPTRRKYMLEDLGSLAGTFIENEVKLVAGTPRVLQYNEKFFLGSSEQAFRIEKV